MRPLLEATGLRKLYGRQHVLDGVSFVISEGAHIGLVGRNGAGKTTMLKILAGDEEADSGTVRLMPWTKLGVLRQHEILPDDVATLAYLSSTSDRPEWDCSKLAARFGIKAKELALPPASLSGGYQMRVKIVAMLLQNPTLLLLDEPMNYLDLPTLLLLESFLRDYPGSYVMTSHDREAMQNICTETWEIANGALAEFPGDLETYLDWKDEQAEYARRTNKRLRREMSDAQAFADRFRAKASLASRAQSKLRHIAKLRTQLKAVGSNLPTAAFRIPCPPVTSGPAVRCVDLSVGYPTEIDIRNRVPDTDSLTFSIDKAIENEIPQQKLLRYSVLDHINLEIARGAKVAIVGENGKGKSTLLKSLGGILDPIAGEVKWWHRANIGYFSQLSEDTLSPDATVLQALTQAAGDASGERILAAAGAFLFRNDDLEKTCRVLSGGERARVRLARLVLREHSVLILDEPTNHLDAETVEVLARALKEYPGTVILVSHARTFMNAIIDTIFEVRDGSVRHYIGTYEEYVSDLTDKAEETTRSSDVARTTPNPSLDEGGETVKKERAIVARENKRVQLRIEEKMKKLDREKSDILAFFFENPTDYSPEKNRRLAELEDELAIAEREWLSRV